MVVRIVGVGVSDGEVGGGRWAVEVRVRVGEVVVVVVVVVMVMVVIVVVVGQGGERKSGRKRRPVQQWGGEREAVQADGAVGSVWIWMGRNRVGREAMMPGRTVVIMVGKREQTGRRRIMQRLLVVVEQGAGQPVWSSGRHGG